VSSVPTKPFAYPKMPLKSAICINFSGGKTSAYMTKMVLDHFREHDPKKPIYVMFANTGQEHEETLKFIDRCDKEFRFGTIWIEAVVNPQHRKGIRHKIVTFDTASRNGAPFEAVIAKHGIQNRGYPQCTSRLKLEPMRSLKRSLGLKPRFTSTAVGIRADEIDRMSFAQMEKFGIFYPCIDAKVTIEDVREWWSKQSFNLNIPSHLGNCTWCWKKSLRKLMTIAKDHPEFLEFPARMERDYATAGGNRKDGAERLPRKFFRDGRSAADLIAEAGSVDFRPFSDEHFIPFDEKLDVGSGCGESCEVGTSDTE
jgi:hypothetical protein